MKINKIFKFISPIVVLTPIVITPFFMSSCSTVFKADGSNWIGSRGGWGTLSCQFIDENHHESGVKVTDGNFYAGRDLKIPERVMMNDGHIYEIKEIGENAFSSDPYLIGTVTFPKTLTLIDSGAFMDCAQLTGDLILPNNIIEINDSAFSYCSGFEKLTFSNWNSIPQWTADFIFDFWWAPNNPLSTETREFVAANCTVDSNTLLNYAHSKGLNNSWVLW